MNLSDLMSTTGVVEHTLGSGGFAGINVGHDADVPHFFDRYSTCHK